MTEAARGRKLTLVFFAVAALLVAGGLLLRSTAPEPEVVAAAGAQPIPLRVLEVRRESLRPQVEVSGLLHARREVEIFAETEGKVVEVGAEELDRVVEDQLLLRADPLLAELAVTRAEAALARARSQLRLAESQLERQDTLAGSAVSSESVLDEAQNSQRVASAAVDEARASIAEARDQLAKKTVLAPFAGVLRSFPVKAGEYVRPGERVAELLEVDRLRITIGLSDREVVAIEPGARAQLSVEARPGTAFEGVVLRVGGATDSQTRKYPVQIEVPNSEGRLLPGMVARIRIELGQAVDVMAIPRDAVAEEFGLLFAFVVEEDPSGQFLARRRRLKVRDVPFRPAELAVIEGLEPGDRVAVSSLRQLSDGAAIRPLETVGSGMPGRAARDVAGEGP
jgi:RND family efflux transporter MFP subunit